MTMATMDPAEMEAMEKDTGTFNDSSDDLDEAAAAPLSKKEAKMAAKKAAEDAEKQAKK